MVCMILDGSCLGRNGVLGIAVTAAEAGCCNEMKARLELHMSQGRNVYDVKTCFLWGFDWPNAALTRKRLKPKQPMLQRRQFSCSV